MKARIAVSLLVLLTAALPALARKRADREAPPATEPAFDLPAREGNVSSKDLAGKLLYVDFWASWCGPCRQEMPLLDHLYQQYSPLGFTMLGVNVEQDPADAQRLLKDTPVTFPILFDTKNEVSKLYDVTAMPSTVIVDRDGKVRFVHKGYQAGYEAEYQTQIRALVAE
jgi:thiol-disulfide isomerase/thioredoxin